jgi:hypothetical protein
VWVTRSTHTDDKTRAAGIAATFETAASEAGTGRMTRERALETVNMILRVDGLPLVARGPALETFVKEVLNAKDRRTASARAV